MECMPEQREKFITLYNEVFDSDGKTKLCGREKCKELIILAEHIDSNTNFGSRRNGMMHIENLKELYTELTNTNNN